MQPEINMQNPSYLCTAWKNWNPSKFFQGKEYIGLHTTWIHLSHPRCNTLSENDWFGYNVDRSHWQRWLCQELASALVVGLSISLLWEFGSLSRTFGCRDVSVTLLPACFSWGGWSDSHSLVCLSLFYMFLCPYLNQIQCRNHWVPLLNLILFDQT